MEKHLLEPKGELTSRVVTDLMAELGNEPGRENTIFVTLRSIRGVRWSALCELAAALRSYRSVADLRLRDATPRLRMLFREVGLYET